VTAMYPEKMIFDVAGFPAIRGRDLVGALVEQTNQWKPTYLLGRQALTLSEVDGQFDVGLDGGTVIRAGAVLITAGMGEFSPRPLPAGDGWLGRGMVHFVPAPDVHRDQDVIVVGGGDSALQEALVLAKYCSKVHIAHRGDKLRAQKHLVDHAGADPKISYLWKTTVEAILGGKMVEKVRVKRDGKSEDMACAGVFAYVGLEPNAAFAPNDIARDERGHLKTSATFETSMAGIYAIGAVRAGYSGLLRDAAVEAQRVGEAIGKRLG